MVVFQVKFKNGKILHQKRNLENCWRVNIRLPARTPKLKDQSDESSGITKCVGRNQ